MISLLLLVGIVMPPLLPHPLTPMQYGFNGAIQDSKVVFNAIDKCQYQNNTVNCAHGLLWICKGQHTGIRFILKAMIDYHQILKDICPFYYSMKEIRQYLYLKRRATYQYKSHQTCLSKRNDISEETFIDSWFFKIKGQEVAGTQIYFYVFVVILSLE